jgi:hypothetical protein
VGRWETVNWATMRLIIQGAKVPVGSPAVCRNNRRNCEMTKPRMEGVPESSHVSSISRGRENLARVRSRLQDKRRQM